MKRVLAAIVSAAALSGCITLSGCQTEPQQLPASSAQTDGPQPGLSQSTQTNTTVAAPAPTPGGNSTPAPAPAIEPTPPAPVSGDEVVATVQGRDIPLKELEGPLMEGYGLNVLLEVIQLDLARQAAAEQGITISQADVDSEVNGTLAAFKAATDQAAAGGATTEPASESSSAPLSAADRDKMLTLLLTSQHITRADFDLAMQRNAYLRKLVTPTAEAQMTDENLHERFNAEYGEKAHIRFIRLPDMVAVSKVQRDLQAGHTFAEEVQLHAYDSLGRISTGEVAFTRQDLNYPANFKMVAFGLKPGAVSDAVQVKDSIFLIQLVELIPPKHATYEEYKDSIRADYLELVVKNGMKQYLQDLGASARQSMVIRDPILKRQWDEDLRNADELKQQLQQEQQSQTTRPSDGPAANAAQLPAVPAPAAAPTTAPAAPAPAGAAEPTSAPGTNN